MIGNCSLSVPGCLIPWPILHWSQEFLWLIKLTGWLTSLSSLSAGIVCSTLSVSWDLQLCFEGNLMHPKICKNNCKLYFSNGHFWLPPFPHSNWFLKHFSMIFLFVLKLVYYSVCFYSLVQDPEHCINKLLMKREFYKLKFVSPILRLCIGSLVSVENTGFPKMEERDRTWGELFCL